METTHSYTIRSWTKTITNGHYTQSMGYALNGNVSEMGWKQNAVTKKYDFVYDGLSRLIEAKSTEGANFSTSYSYDKHGNMLTLTRQGVTPTRAQGLVDNLSLSYNGNQLKKVSDQISNAGLAGSMDFKDYADEETEYSYNKNGAMTSDLNKGITSIAYNYLNLPQEMLINASAAEAKTWYTYSATGQKLSVVYKWNSERQITPLTGSNLKAITGTVPDENSMDKDLTLDYVGNFIYENDSLKRILVEGGYIEDGNYYFYITDHLGNNRIVANASGDVVQSNEYYPFGLLMATSTEADKQPYKYGSKELDSYNGLNLYDFEARFLDGMRFTTVDPLAEKYFSWSPYAYVANNPLKFIDPTGMSLDDYYNEKGQYLYTDENNSDNIKIIAQKDWNNLLSNYPKEGRTESSLSFREDLQHTSSNIEDKLLSAEAYSNIFTDILSKQKDIKTNTLGNGKVAVFTTTDNWKVKDKYNNPSIGLGKNASISSDGKRLTAVIIATENEEDNRYMFSTVSNIYNLLGAHEYIGHGIKGWGDKDFSHYKVYDYQIKTHKSWRKTSPLYKESIMKSAKTYEYQRNIK